MIKSNYTSWNINEKEFSEAWTDIQKLHFFARYAVLAPSGHNTQPWKLSTKETSLVLLLNQDHYLSMDGSGLLSVEPCISLGTFLEVFDLAARGFGYELAIKTILDGHNVAEISIRTRITAKPKLLDAIVKRVSNRNPYIQTPVDQILLKELHGTKFSGVKTTTVVDHQDIAFVAKQTEIAIGSIMTNPLYRKVLSHWVRTNQTRKFDGMPGFTHGFGNLKSLASKSVIRYAPAGGPQAKKSGDLIKKSGALIIVRCENNSQESFMNAGRIYSRICVNAQMAGFATSALGASVLDSNTRENMKKHFKITDRPVYLIRLGKTNVRAEHSPRWPIEKILT